MEQKAILIKSAMKNNSKQTKYNFSKLPTKISASQKNANKARR
jgi:hypothetical protein